jgi:hypothetical protein
MNRLDYTLTRETIVEGFDGETEWFAPRAALLPPNGAVLLMTRSVAKGGASDVFLGGHDMRSDDLGRTWSPPAAHAALGRLPHQGGRVEIVPADLVPAWHAVTGKVLALGHTACYAPGARTPVFDDSIRIYGSYSVYDAAARTWSQWQALEFPDPDRFYLAAGGAAQRVDLPNGDILWPFYCQERKYVGTNYNKARFFATVVRCSFDGKTVRYLEHGDELRVDAGRGLCEPSLTRFGGRFYLTLRNDLRGYVTTGADGLHFDAPVPWLFDDGTELGSYNTQQHWVTCGDGLFLTYTRRGANNDHIIRHRAPLFMAQVDPERLCVVRDTERILLPDTGAQYGNGGALTVSPHESWVLDAECMKGDAKNPHDTALTVRRGANNRVCLCRIEWDHQSRA